MKHASFPRMQGTLIEKIAHWAEQRPAQHALHGVRNGNWYHLSWSEYWENVRALGKAFIARGHRVGECVAFLGANYPEWVQYEYGLQAVGGIPAPIYGTSTEEQLAYIIKHSDSRILVVDGEEQLIRVLRAEQHGLFRPLEHIFTFAEVPGIDDPRIQTFGELLELGRLQPDTELEQRLHALRPDTVCLLIYTSGTTGVPKGVELDHAGQLIVGDAVMDFCPTLLKPGHYQALSYLPLTAQAEQCFTNVFTLITGGEVSFCPNLQEIKDYLVKVRPTVFLGMPRVWEKFEAALRARLLEAKGLKAKLAAWAMKEELAAFNQQVELGDPNYTNWRRRLARKLVIDKIKSALGFDRLELAFSGSAPIAKDTQEFFASLGVCIYEGYGLSETSGVATVSDRDKPRFGTVGRSLRGVELRLGEEDEIQLSGRNMTRGYRAMPEESKALYTEDGWLKTGDIGAFDAEGNLKITGRLKELLITAGGKNVAPVELENYLKSIAGIGQAVVLGDRKPYLTALLTLDPENLDDLRARVGTESAAIAELAADEKVRAYLAEQIETVCNSKVARYQTIKKFALLSEEFSTEGGELTATLKLRRNAIEQKYATLIASMYGEDPGRTSDIRALIEAAKRKTAASGG